jgi:hypothetical protein
MANSLAAVRSAVTAEKAAENMREQGERHWRESWWATTDALANVPSTPRDGLSAAIALVVETLGYKSPSYAKRRRICGQRFSTLEGAERAKLLPRFAIAASDAGTDPETAAGLILQAEHEGASLREFNAALTGRSWTNAPENMTPAERITVARRELQQRPHEVLADDATRESADEASIEIRATRAPRLHPHHTQNVMAEFDKNSAAAFGVDIAVQHLKAAKSELLMAMFTRDIHGANAQAWREALSEMEKALLRVQGASTHETWSEDDRRLAAEMGLNI